MRTDVQLYDNVKEFKSDYLFRAYSVSRSLVAWKSIQALNNVIKCLAANGVKMDSHFRYLASKLCYSMLLIELLVNTWLFRKKTIQY